LVGAGLRPARTSANGGSMGQPVVHFEVQGNDREALTSFYRDLFGWETKDVSEMNYTMVETGGEGGINGGIGGIPPGAPGGVTFYVGSDDVAGALSRAEELGGRTVAGPMDMPDGDKWALLADPEGHVVGLYGSG
jgi:predicted enzyme related to lactoylglutathione lyase